MINNPAQETVNKKKRFAGILFIVLLSITAIFLYHQIVLGEYYFIFISGDLGVDSFAQSVPGFIHNAYYAAEEGRLPLWSFYAGLGQNFYGMYADPFNALISLMGVETIPYLLGIFHVIKIILAGGFFYLYLRTMGRSTWASAICGIGFAFCGNIIGRAAWVGYPNEVVCVALLLWAFERFFIKNNWYLLPLAFGFLCVTLKGYYVILYTGILLVYALFRFASEKQFKIKPFTKYYLKCIGFIALGLGLAAIVLIPNFIVNFSADRFLAVESAQKFTPFNFPGPTFWSGSNYAHYFLRTVATGIIDTRGSSANVLGSAYYYCGLICLIMIPYAYIQAKTKQKVWYSLMLGAILLLTIFPYSVYFLSGFQTTFSYKILIMWVFVVLLYLGSLGLDKYLRSQKLTLKYAAITSGVVIIGVVFSIVYLINNEYLPMDRFNWLVVTGVPLILAIICGLLFVYKKQHSKKVLAGLVTVVCIEAILFNYSIVWVRPNVAPVMSRQMASNDNIQEFMPSEEISAILNNLKIEDTSFYRIDANGISGLNSSLKNKFFGIPSYQGGTSHSAQLLNLYSQLGGTIQSRNLTVLGGIPYTNSSFLHNFPVSRVMNSILGAKYQIFSGKLPVMVGYQKTNIHSGSYTVFKNKYALPLGYTYDSYMTEEEFSSLDVIQKREALLETGIVPNDSNMNVKEISVSELQLPNEKLLSENALEDSQIHFSVPEGSYEFIDASVVSPIVKVTEDTAILRWALKQPDIANKKLSIVTFTLVSETDGYVSIRPNTRNSMEQSRVESQTFAIQEGENLIRLEIPRDEVNSVYLELFTAKTFAVEDFQWSLVDAEEYEENINNNYTSRTKYPFQVEHFSQNYIVGKTTSPEDSVYCFNVPYDSGWNFYLDGEKVEPTLINLNFMSLNVPAGVHQVELSFTPAGYQLGKIVTTASIVIFVLLVGYSIYRKTKKRKDKMEQEQKLVENAEKLIVATNTIKRVSIVVPIYNEVENVAALHEEIKAVCENNNYQYEIIFIDDGSTDDTHKVVHNLKPLKYIRMRRNFGQTAAMDAGIHHAQYDYIITMDGDRQNDPDDIPRLINYLEAHDLDVVSGWRKNRKDTFGKRFASRTANLLRGIIVKDGIHDSGCSLKIYRRECFEGVHLYGEMHRFIPALLIIRGFTVGEIVVNHRPRTAGTTKYNWKRSFKGLVDMISLWFWGKYASRPLHLFGSVGLITMFGASISGLITIIQFIVRGKVGDTAWPLLTALLLIAGIQFLVFGLLADISSKTYRELTEDKSYNIRSIEEFNDEKSKP